MNELTAFTPSTLATASTEALKAELARTLTVTADYLMYIAGIWQELTNRGVDLSDLRHGLMQYIPMIANQRMDARLVINYAGQKTLLAALSRLPLDEQARIAEHGVVPVFKLDGNQKQEMMVPLSDLSAAEVYQVFGEDKIRDEQEQLKLLMYKSQVEHKKILPRKTSKIKIDEDSRLLVVGRSTLKPAQVLEVLGEFYGVDLFKIIANGGKNE